MLCNWYFPEKLLGEQTLQLKRGRDRKLRRNDWDRRGRAYERCMENDNLIIIIRYNEVLIRAAHIHRRKNCVILPFQETCCTDVLWRRIWSLIWYWSCLLAPGWSDCRNNSYWSPCNVLNVSVRFSNRLVHSSLNLLFTQRWTNTHQETEEDGKEHTHTHSTWVNTTSSALKLMRAVWTTRR